MLNLAKTEVETEAYMGPKCFDLVLIFDAKLLDDWILKYRVNCFGYQWTLLRVLIELVNQTLKITLNGSETG
jgi:hypothetical protein